MRVATNVLDDAGDNSPSASDSNDDLQFRRLIAGLQETQKSLWAGQLSYLHVMQKQEPPALRL